MLQFDKIRRLAVYNETRIRCRGGQSLLPDQPGHRGVVLDDPTGALARLQLARAYAISADSSKARAAYREFLTLWKNADPDVPIFKRAKAEYASLR